MRMLLLLSFGFIINWFFAMTYFTTLKRTRLTKKPSRMPPKKVLPPAAKRATAEEYRKARKKARRKRLWKGCKDKGVGASLKT